METSVLRIPYQDKLTDEELMVVCEANPEWRIERNNKGQLIIMSPTGGKTGNRNFKITGIFWAWADAHSDLGYGFDSSTGFTLPDRSMRSPDVSWVEKSRWEKLSEFEQIKFAAICPDFVIELLSDSDEIGTIKEKMSEWVKNGCRLGWLIDPFDQRVFIYTSGKKVETISGFNQKLSGGNLLPGFELDLAKLK